MFAGHLGAATVFGKFENRRITEFYKQHAAGLPYYAKVENVVDLNTAFFFPDEEQDHKPSLFYPGRSINIRPDGVL